MPTFKGDQIRLQWARIAEDRIQEAKKEADLGKAAEYFVKATPEALQAIGVSDGEFANMSAREQAAAVQGYMQAQTLQQAMQKFKQQQAADEALQAAVRMAGTSTATGPGNATSAMAPGMSPMLDRALPPVTGTASTPVTSERLRMALGQNPAAVNAPNFDNLLRAIQTQQMEPMFKPGETNFALPEVADFKRIPTGPNTSQLIYAPRTPGAAVPITGPGGEQLGMGLPGRTGITPLRTGQVTEQDQFKALERLHSDYVRNAGLYPGKVGEMWQGKADEIAGQMNDLVGGGGGAPQRAAGTADKRKFTKGQRVRQGGVLYVFDGKNWNAVK
jgi:hypothetical protein